MQIPLICLFVWLRFKDKTSGRTDPERLFQRLEIFSNSVQFSTKLMLSSRS
jgi:hypothetical protein